MNIKKRLLNCYAMKNTKEASYFMNILARSLSEKIPDDIPVKKIEKEKKEYYEQLGIVIVLLGLASFELKFGKWDTTLELINTMPNMEI